MGKGTLMATQGAVDGFDALADGVGLIGVTEKDFVLCVAQYLTHLLNLFVADLGIGRTVIVGPLAGAVNHETRDVGVVDKEAGEGFAHGERRQAKEHLGGDANVLDGLWTALGIASEHGLGGHVGLVALFPKTVTAGLLAVALDDSHIPFAYGHAYGADSRHYTLCR